MAFVYEEERFKNQPLSEVGPGSYKYDHIASLKPSVQQGFTTSTLRFQDKKFNQEEYEERVKLYGRSIQKFKIEDPKQSSMFQSSVPKMKVKHYNYPVVGAYKIKSFVDEQLGRMKKKHEVVQYNQIQNKTKMIFDLKRNKNKARNRIKRERELKNLENFKWKNGKNNQFSMTSSKMIDEEETRVNSIIDFNPKKEKQDQRMGKKNIKGLKWQKPSLLRTSSQNRTHSRSDHLINKNSLGPGFYKYTEPLHHLKEFKFNESSAFASKSDRNLAPTVPYSMQGINKRFAAIPGPGDFDTKNNTILDRQEQLSKTMSLKNIKERYKLPSKFPSVGPGHYQHEKPMGDLKINKSKGKSIKTKNRLAILRSRSTKIESIPHKVKAINSKDNSKGFSEYNLNTNLDTQYYRTIGGRFGSQKRFNSGFVKRKAKLPGPGDYIIEDNKDFEKESAFFADKVSRGLVYQERQPGAMEILLNTHEEVKEWENKQNYSEEKPFQRFSEQKEYQGKIFKKQKTEKSGARYDFKKSGNQFYISASEFEPKKLNPITKTVKPSPCFFDQVRLIYLIFSPRDSKIRKKIQENGLGLERI